MYRNAQRLLACLLSFLLVIDTASAGWFIGNCFQAVDCCNPCVVECCPPVSCCEVSCNPCCGDTMVAHETSCGCSGETSHTSIDNPEWTLTIADEEPHEPTPAPVMEVAPVPALESEGFSSAPIAELEEPVELEAPPEPVVSEFVEPAPVEMMPEEPVEVAEPEEIMEPEVIAEEPMQPEEDLFGGFDDEPTEVAEEMPAEEVMEEPADDLFGGFGEETAVAEPEVMPAEPAAQEEDLFGGFAEEAPMEEESAEDDLFGGFGEEPAAAEEPAEPMAPADEAADDLFGGFSEEAAPLEEATDDAADDLFGGFGEDPMPAEAEEAADDFLDTPAEEAPENQDDEAFDDLFGGFSSVLREPGGYQSDENRNWVDNTGSFSCVARLVSVDGNSVLLAKTTGKMSTVPLSRLSQADLEFVNRQALAKQQVEMVHMAQR